jgi:hypothetical protein
MKIATPLSVAMRLAQYRCGRSPKRPDPGSNGCLPCSRTTCTPAHLWGLWRVRFGGEAGAATVLFEKHPERGESVRGAINRDSVQSLLAGDVDDGVLTLDESDDGLQISAIWSGNVVAIHHAARSSLAHGDAPKTPPNAASCCASCWQSWRPASDCGTRPASPIRGYRPRQPVAGSVIGQRQHSAPWSTPSASAAAISRRCLSTRCRSPTNMTHGLPQDRDPHPAVGAHQDRAGPADRRRPPHAERLAVVRLHPAVVLAAVQRRHLAAVSQHRPRARAGLHLPHRRALPGGWRLRYSGIRLVHQSNGQSLPLSRSWNRVYLMAGLEKDNRFSCTRPAWARLPERKGAMTTTPTSATYIGRAEFSGYWNVDKRQHTLGMTVRHSLRNAGPRLGAAGVAAHAGQGRADGGPQRPAHAHPAVQRLRRRCWTTTAAAPCSAWA